MADVAGNPSDSYDRILQSVNESNIIKYMPYRIAVKLSVLQKLTCLDKVSLYMINGVYEQHKGKNFNLVDKAMLEDILFDIYYAVHKEYVDFHFDVEEVTKVLVQLLGQIFSKYTKKQINLRSAFTIIACLSCDRLRMRLGYMFQLNCLDNKFGLTKEYFRNFLRDLSLLLEFLSEKILFESSSLNSIIDNCFQNLNNPDCINEDQFMQWFMTEPPILEWLQIFYRIKMAENVNHEVKCKVCKLPVKGLRYFCLKCVNYNQCQNCFLIGATNKKHKLKHAMQEYCWLETPQQLYTQYFKSYLGRIFGLTSKIRYLPVELPSDIIESRQNALWTKESSTTSLDSSTVKSPRQELQSVISQIERENRLLEIEVNTLKRGDSQFEAFLDQHRSKIERQLIRLKQLKNHLSGTFGRGKMKRMQSTPLIVSRPDRQDITAAAANLSPIFSVNSSNVAATTAEHSGLSALSTLYGDKMGEFTLKTGENEFSRWLGPKIAAVPCAAAKSQLDGTYIEKPSSEMPATDPSDKENRAKVAGTDSARPDHAEQPAVLSDIQNKRNAPPRPRIPEKSSAPVRRQTSCVWLNSSREYAKQPSNDDDNKDMDELHTELDKILDQLQKLVT
ncbi:dystrotelin-like isoform X2 [Sipha flava]|uniref:Dystrophin-1 n=1 Tax=Sipha flava TaxID=143950 RepID=A0A2S2QEC0_9HEMI|nr:dystrotelin-like isoform X2 [Sipha flava]XP_025405905.1 dystrotelin-like isoform X2 [Sipha flava]XP_025405907.1 dystrotelin-like isoform X2 [Sipha flava]